MKTDKYPLRSEESYTVFEFISWGPKGFVHKLVHFQKTDAPGLYNLAFGDKNHETGELDDLAKTNNGDSEKVLATVVAALYAFFTKHPEALVYATGSTTSRTRLYRRGITKYYDEMVIDFQVFGQVGNEFHLFETGKDYSGFLAQRKKT
ncbi:hypothetical protein A3860_07555 [Niastella vici]|uniref:Uncharacterized protein n=1 Tax=Niastella vici TaxID=1703345 RepID=A0A1V9FIR3_9BACT|nr:hypothetical protein [Niastella vici]OQP58171.1 hypothetical protein A3860_07555 [Niastella vici]